MNFDFKNLDTKTRQLMLKEVQNDINSQNLYLSKRFNPSGISAYTHLLIEAINNGNEQSLAESLRNNNCFNTTELRKGKPVKVPVTAPTSFAEGEFNRFYIRALCVIALESGQSLEIYRARYSENPRAESLLLIGKTVDAYNLLSDLRNNTGVDTALGLPPGPNSGICVKLI